MNRTRFDFQGACALVREHWPRQRDIRGRIYHGRQFRFGQLHQKVEIRQEPNLSSEVIAHMPYGQEVTAIARNETNPAEWVQIQRPDHAGRGWVYVNADPNAIKITGDVTTLPIRQIVKVTATPTLQVFERPDSTVILEALDADKELTVIGRHRESTWLQINSLKGAGFGWVKADYVNTSADISTLPITYPVKAAAKAVLKIRNSPAGTATVIQSLQSGQEVIGIGRNAESTWLQIQPPDGAESGWVSVQDVTVSGDINTLPVKTG